MIETQRNKKKIEAQEEVEALFFRRRRCDLSDHDCILFNLTCNSAEPILT